MAWLESNQDVWRHYKTLKLSRLLGVEKPTAVGYLHGLWYWCMDFAPDGVLSDFDPEDIAVSVEWKGAAQDFIDAIIKSGYADKSGDEIRLHDWNEYTGKLLGKRASERERKRIEKENHKLPDAHTTEDSETSTEVPQMFHGSSTEDFGNININTNTNINTTLQEPHPPTPRKRGGGRGASEKPSAPPKTKFSEFVSLTSDEHSSLVAKLGEEGATRCIALLDNYKGACGKKYVSDYHAILNWVIKRYEEEQAKSPHQPQSPYQARGRPANQQRSNPFLDGMMEEHDNEPI
jgi:hypothetical protein